MKFKIIRSSIWDDEILPCSELLDKGIKLEVYSDIDIRNFRGFDEFDKFTGKKNSWLSKGVNHCINKDGNIQREFPNKNKGWFLEINSLEELMEFKSKYDEIIIREDYKNPMINVIEIYDDYRE